MPTIKTYDDFNSENYTDMGELINDTEDAEDNYKEDEYQEHKNLDDRERARDMNQTSRYGY